MQIKMYERLPEQAILIRKSVFMGEQGFKNEFDEVDEIATHIVIFENDKPVATCRFFYSEQKDCFVIGRIAVSKIYRGKNYGAVIIKNVEKEIYNQGGMRIVLSAQCRASQFYKKQGYQIQGDSYLDEGCPHIWMYKELKGELNYEIETF